MMRSLLIGTASGMRALGPLAVAGASATRGRLAPLPDRARAVADPRVAAALALLAIGELIGDKLPDAPDRTVPIGLAGRAITGAAAGALVSAPDRRMSGALVAGAAAVASAFATLALRRRAMAVLGPRASGLAEDATMLGLSALAARRLTR